MIITRKRFAILLKIALFFLFTFYNCDSEENIIEEETVGSTLEVYTLKKIKFKDLIKDEAFSKSFKALNNSFNKKPTTNKKTRKTYQYSLMK